MCETLSVLVCFKLFVCRDEFETSGGEVLLLGGACGLEMEPQAGLRFGNLKCKFEDAVVVGRDGLCHHHDCRLSIDKLRD